MSDIEHLLREYRKEAPVKVEALIQNLGVGLEAKAALDEGISGHIKREESGKYVIRANGSEHDYRRRFTLAHELGHYVLHRSILDLSGGVNDNTMYRTDTGFAGYNSHIHAIHERQANSFAANLLMPDELVHQVWREVAEAEQHPSGLPSLRELYRHFQVSPSAMKWKLQNMGLGARQ